ncbi:MAG: zinc ribbon domain-containing protein [Candidatus Binatia bacterium]
MPIYEYRCRACRTRYSVLTLRIGEPVQPQCTACGSPDGERLMSRFAMPRSAEDRLGGVSDRWNLDGIDAENPQRQPLDARDGPGIG